MGGDVNLEQVPSFNYVYLAVSPGAVGGEQLTPEVREAIRLALDYDGLIDATVGGAGRKQASPIPNGFAGTADLPEPAQDLDKAKQLMADAGVTELTLDATFPHVQRLRSRLRHGDAEGADRPEGGQHQPRAEPGRDRGVGREDRHRRHPGDHAVLRTGPHRLEPVRAVLRSARRVAVAGLVEGRPQPGRGRTCSIRPSPPRTPPSAPRSTSNWPRR